MANITRGTTYSDNEIMQIQIWGNKIKLNFFIDFLLHSFKHQNMGEWEEENKNNPST